MKILITGGSGFIGNAIVRKFSQHFETIVIDKAENPGFDNNVKYCKMDLSDQRTAEIISNLIDEDTILIHLAALIGGVNYFVKFPFSILVENSLIDSNVFSAMMLKKPKKFLAFSSSMVFESAPSGIKFNEELLNFIPPPITAYGFSKLKTEIFAKSLYEQYDVPFLILRPFNAVGIGDLPGLYGHVLPTFCLRAINKENPFKILGDGQQIRSFLHIEDLSDACFMLATSNIENQSFNIGTPNSMKIIDLAKLIWKQINNTDLNEFEFTETIKYDVKYRCPDVNRIMSLGWMPKYSIEDTIYEVSKWLMSDLKLFNVNDIRHKVEIISKAEFKEWYYNRNYSLSDMSDILGISISTLYRLMKSYEIQTKQKSFRSYHLSKELFEYLYLSNSTKEIAKILHIDIRVIHNKLVKYGLANWKDLKFKSHSYQMKKVWSDFEYKAERIKKMMVEKKYRPNKLEILFHKMFQDKIKYTGNGTRYIQLDGRVKNPDFEVVGQKNKVIELFGDYWHRNDNPTELIDKYEKKGILCLIIWEHEVYETPDEVFFIVEKFINTQ